MNKNALKIVYIILISLTVLLIPDCITSGGTYTRAADQGTAQIQKLYAQDYYEMQEPPPGLHYSPKKSDREFVLYVLHKYSKDSFFIVYNYIQMPAYLPEYAIAPYEDFMEWADTGNRLELVNSIATIVHECNHGLTHSFIKKILTIFFVLLCLC